MHKVLRVLKGKSSVGKCHFLFIGAHPDDADIESGGTAIRILDSGGEVTFVSMTNGDAGHQSIGGGALASRRRLESLAVSTFLGLDYIVLDNHDAELQPSLENRKVLIELIRRKQPDIIVTHRPNDYHADHRATSILVQDASYLLSVPNVCPLVERLEYNPLILYHQDNFRKPTPFNLEIFVDITGVFDRKIKSLNLQLENFEGFTGFFLS